MSLLNLLFILMKYFNTLFNLNYDYSLYFIYKFDSIEKL